MSTRNPAFTTIATWNVNGVRARVDRVIAWLQAHPVDVLCMQEIKALKEQFPEEAFCRLGYQVAISGQKGFNGVAIVSRAGLGDVVCELTNNPDHNTQKRLIGATVSSVIGDIRLYCAYFPNGQAVGSDKYEYKLQWMDALRVHLQQQLKQYDRVVLCGDFNVAPHPRDTYDPAVWEGKILCSEPERQALASVAQAGLHDALRFVYPEEQIFTWWDYRALGFAQNHGLRLDHFYVSQAVLASVSDVIVDRQQRKGKLPSDHAPVMMTLRERAQKG